MNEENAYILIVDDEPLIRKSLFEILRIEGYNVDVASNGKEAIDKLKEAHFDIVITDVKMPNIDGIELLKMIRSDFGHMAVILITGFGMIETAVEAMRLGAFDYITKPIVDNEIKIIIKKIIEQKKLVDENIFLKKRLAATSRECFCNLIGADSKMQRIYNMVEAIANTKATVLLTGESGTGKRLVAMAIHSIDNKRKDKPFVEVSCGALPETLLESELFGHVKGAFTGAIKDRVGRFELADGGVILLDEIDAFSPALQVKLLRVLQEGEFERVGDTKTFKVDVRIIAATNRNLDELIKKGSFREDLYYRLNVISIDIPPLRERRQDIPLLVNSFIQKFCKANNKKISVISQGALAKLINYSWPGNVRELENCIERALILSNNGSITEKSLPKNFDDNNLTAVGSNGFSLRDALRDPEREILLKALEENNWNRKRTCDVLRINRTTLYNKMKRFGISGSK